MTDRVTRNTPLPLRNDTLLGVCEALGQDFGMNPLWLRLAFIAPLFWQPMLTVAVYLALGLVVAASRYAFPRASQPQARVAPVADPEPVEEELKFAA